jgi:hypothetical protein
MTDPPWLVKCRENIAKIPGGKMCHNQQCQEVLSYIGAVCTCQPPYQNGCPDPPTPDCCSYGPSSPIYVFSSKGGCYCCCGYSVHNTNVAVGKGGARPIEEIEVGDTVHAALDPQLKNWGLLPARFSSGTGAGSDGIEVGFGDAGVLETLVASPDQLFLVKGGRLKRASRLVAGKDSLTRGDGSVAPVRKLKAVKSTGPQHRIATSDGPATDWAGHLIVVNGVVCGDYALQVADLDSARPEMMANGHAGLPTFGTAAYAKRHAPPPDAD